MLAVVISPHLQGWVKEFCSHGVPHANTFLSLMSRYNLLFFASGGGKFNYQGTKRWLEDNLDHTGE